MGQSEVGMSWLGTLLKEIFVDSDPDRERKPMSPKQMYDYLISSRRRTPEEQAVLEYLHKALGKDKWD